jgi:hypothetical protein
VTRELVPDAGQGHLEVGPVPVHLVDEKQGGQSELGHLAPQFLGQGFDPVHGVHHEDHRVHGLKQIGQVTVEIAVARGVEKEMAVLVEGEGRDAGLGAAPALDLLGS